MKKDTKSKGKAEKLIKKYFDPNERLIEWTFERLRLEKERFEPKTEKNRKTEQEKRWYKDMKASAARKTEILNDIIFPSLANLIYFSEIIKSNPILNEVFEKDEIQLFGTKLVKDDIKFLERGGDPDSRRFFKNNLARLISNILTVKQSDAREKYDLNDFRLSLLYQIQSIVRDKVVDILERNHGTLGQITRSASEDFENTLRWLAFLAGSSSKEVNFEFKREIRVEPKDCVINHKN